MASETIHKCDICKEIKDRNELCNISIDSSWIVFKHSPKLRIDICTDCLKKKGFVVDVPDEWKGRVEVEKTNNATIEDKLFEILQDIGVQFVS